MDEVIHTAMNINALVFALPTVENMHLDVHLREHNPEDTLFLTLTSQEVSLVDFGLQLVGLLYPCLVEEGDELYSKVGEAIMAQKGELNEDEA